MALRHALGLLSILVTSAVFTETSAAQANTEQPLRVLLGSWNVTASTFGGLSEPKPPQFIATPAAGGLGVYSVWSQGTGTSAYEASALWSYDSGTGQVRVLEVNSAGAADLHAGTFNADGSLLLEQRDVQTNALVQSRRFVMLRDTIRMEAVFYARDGAITRHSATLVRR